MRVGSESVLKTFWSSSAPVFVVMSAHNRPRERSGQRQVAQAVAATGSDGFEIYLAAGDTEHVFRTLLSAGEPLGGVPVEVEPLAEGE